MALMKVERRGIPDKNIAIQSSVLINRATITLFVIVSHMTYLAVRIKVVRPGQAGTSVPIV